MKTILIKWTGKEDENTIPLEEEKPMDYNYSSLIDDYEIISGFLILHTQNLEHKPMVLAVNMQVILSFCVVDAGEIHKESMEVR